jgi:membrane-bound ClpP family serine protease
MTPQPNPAVHLFSDIRKIALITFIAAVLGLLIPVWRLTQQAAAIGLPVWARVPVLLFGYLFTAIMPVFFFALYRNQGTLRFSKHLRLLSLIAALVFGLIVAWDLSGWVESIGSYWRTVSMLDWRRDPRTVNQSQVS